MNFLSRSTWLCLFLVLVPNAGPLHAQGEPAFDRQTVRVAGTEILVETAGVNTRLPGAPVIVFESGAGTPLENWAPIVAGVSSFASTVAYDRPGIGGSEWDGESPTPEHSAAVLRELLWQMGISPPYILVGHSWGGVLARYFASEYEVDVQGVVYVDPTEFILPQEDVAPILEAVGATVPNFERPPPSPSAPAPQAPTAAESTRAAIFGFLDGQHWRTDRPNPPENQQP